MFSIIQLKANILFQKIQKKIDKTISNLANPLLKYEIVKIGRIVVSENEELLFKFEPRVYQEYEDYRYFQRYYFDPLERELLED